MENVLQSLHVRPDRWMQVLLIGTLFVLPISSTAKSIFLSLSLIAVLGIDSNRKTVFQILSEPYSKAALGIVMVALLACLWSPAHLSQKLFVMEKYSKLLYFPLLIVGFQDSTLRERGLQAFIFAMFITCILSILKFHGFLQSIDFSPDYVFRDHIITSFMISFAVYLSLWFLYLQTGAVRIVYAGVATLLTYQVLFINAGRTGYIIYFLLLTIFICQFFTWQKMVIGMLFVLLLLISSYFNSTIMKTRVDAIGQQLYDYQHNKKDSDIGYRLQFHDFAYQLFKKHPLIGGGTASFTYLFATQNPVPSWNRKLLEPHSQYWLVASEFGIFGVLALFSFFFALVRESFKLQKMKPIAFAMIIPFFIGNLSDSLLFFSGPGYFFLLIMTLCFGERVEGIGFVSKSIPQISRGKTQVA